MEPNTTIPIITIVFDIFVTIMIMIFNVLTIFINFLLAPQGALMVTMIHYPSSAGKFEIFSLFWFQVLGFTVFRFCHHWNNAMFVMQEEFCINVLILRPVSIFILAKMLKFAINFQNSKSFVSIKSFVNITSASLLSVKMHSSQQCSVPWINTCRMIIQFHPKTASDCFFWIMPSDTERRCRK